VNVLVVDVGGTNVKMLVTGAEAPRKFPSGKDLTPDRMVSGVQDATVDWDYDAVSIGFPGPVMRGQVVCEPHNLGAGWLGFDFTAAFGCPVKIINDAAMQALGSYEGGKMLFLGLGTGLGSAFIVGGNVEPMELAHLPYRKATYEDYVGRRGLKRMGVKKWSRHVFRVVSLLTAALQPEYVVLGGGNARKLKELPPGCRLGGNANAFEGGFRLWEKVPATPPAANGNAEQPAHSQHTATPSEAGR
jgi:polyphosphate glucokinase